jgi:hypothetical protein
VALAPDLLGVKVSLTPFRHFLSLYVIVVFSFISYDRRSSGSLFYQSNAQ